MGNAAITAQWVDGVQVLTIVSPARRNALNPDMRTELAGRITAACSDKSVRAIVIRGEGVHFCAGADLTAIEHGDSPPTIIQLTERIRDAQNLVRSVTLGCKPVIAAVEGAAFGAGLALAAACDFVVAAHGARFGANFVRLGITAEFGLLCTLTRRVGHQVARRIITLAEELTGAEAFRIGFADRLVADGDTLQEAMSLSAKLALLSPTALAASKRAFAAAPPTVEEALRQELDIMPLLAGGNDFKEAVRAFREGRPPTFSE